MDVVEVLIEHWPRLQSVNIFIQFSQPFIDTDAVHIGITKTEIRIDGDAKFIINIRDHFNLNTNSLSLLIIKSNYMSFRLNTNNNNGFFEEFLQTSQDGPVSTTDDALQLSIIADNEVSLICFTCTAPLTPTIRFQRVLELPTDNLDSSEWFCHKHNHTTAQHSTELTSVENEKFNSAKVTARPQDLLYGQFFFLVNSKQLQNTLVCRDRVHCKRCLSHLGELQVRTDCTKFWNENVLFRSHSNENGGRLFGNSIFNHFLWIVCRVIRDFDFILSATAGVVPTIKMLFESRSSSSGDENVRYLMVQVMNKNVELYRQIDGEIADEITLRKIDSMKILFRQECALQSALISFWLADATVTHTQISIRMMESAVERLRLNSLLVPECYRSNCGFTMSYLFK